eukprot:12917232-Prorocentrum_lima.AAC.1
MSSSHGLFRVFLFVSRLLPGRVLSMLLVVVVVVQLYNFHAMSVVVVVVMVVVVPSVASLLLLHSNALQLCVIPCGIPV